MTDGLHTDLAIVGGGPAGCAAAVMAASLGLSSVIVESRALCHKLPAASSLTNVLGGFASGTDFAEKIRQDVARTSRCEVLLGRSAIHVDAADDHVAVRLDNDAIITAPFAIVATGVQPLRLADVDWIHTDIDEPPPLWQATRAALTDTEALVLGIDRPLGTLLRSMPDVDTRLVVAYSPAEQYKAAEVSHDPRIVLIPTSHASLRVTANGMLSLRARSHDGDTTHTTTRVFGNLGSRPLMPGGDIATGPDGYCPPDQQHHRVLIAGDLRAARRQRIMTALGSGAEAALAAYYQLMGIEEHFSFEGHPS